ncbi:uncharacterized protein [Rutidosis leptorrhynchoides]|uniref:uncharacterized protein n=1 Tax=Rutidosis leptorrhynchoides TaxID=125765 RepID=UPI003A98FE2B
MADATVSVMNWIWVRNPSGRTTNELTSLITLLASKPVNVGRQDAWSWSLASNGLFTVNKLSKLIDEHVLGSFNSQQESSKERLLVKVELGITGIDLHSVRCPLCDEDLESVDHALNSCKLVFEIWVRVYNWWGLGKPTSLNLIDILSDNNTSSMSSGCREVWQAIKWITLYIIWKNRNTSVVQAKSWNAPMTLNEMQAKSFEWIAIRVVVCEAKLGFS